MCTLIRDWAILEGRGGNISYPVEGCGFGYIHNKNKWTSEAGQARARMIQYIIDNI